VDPFVALVRALDRHKVRFHTATTLVAYRTPWSENYYFETTAKLHDDPRCAASGRRRKSWIGNTGGMARAFQARVGGPERAALRTIQCVRRLFLPLCRSRRSSSIREWT
jgi:hypothetical protein